MLKQLLYPAYRGLHDLLYASSSINPLMRSTWQGKPVLKGHISEEHLNNPELDIDLLEDLKNSGIETGVFEIDTKGYKDYLKKVDYPESYYGGGLDAKQNFIEKTLEHYVCTSFINFGPETVFMDVAACTSPFYKIVRKLYGVKTSYQQDLIFKKGLHGDQIGGYGSEIPLPDNSLDAVTLHCSLEHFEGDSDTEFFQEMQRVLKPGGVIVILPFYIAREYSIHVDPAFNLLRNHKAEISKDGPQLRYCNWYQFFSRHYDVDAIHRRILKPASGLKLKVMRVDNFREVDASCYLRFVGVFTKTDD